MAEDSGLHASVVTTPYSSRHAFHNRWSCQDSLWTNPSGDCMLFDCKFLNLIDIRTWCFVQCARYAARKQGLTAVPVIQGIAAVVTTATCLGSACKLLSPFCSLGGMFAWVKHVKYCST